MNFVKKLKALARTRFLPLFLLLVVLLPPQVIRDLGARYNEVDAHIVLFHPPPIQHPPPIRRAIARMRRKARNPLLSKQKHGQTYARSEVSTGFMVTSGVG